MSIPGTRQDSVRGRRLYRSPKMKTADWLNNRMASLTQARADVYSGAQFARASATATAAMAEFDLRRDEVRRSERFDLAHAYALAHEIMAVIARDLISPARTAFHVRAATELYSREQDFNAVARLRMHLVTAWVRVKRPRDARLALEEAKASVYRSRDPVMVIERLHRTVDIEELSGRGADAALLFDQIFERSKRHEPPALQAARQYSLASLLLTQPNASERKVADLLVTSHDLLREDRHPLFRHLHLLTLAEYLITFHKDGRHAEACCLLGGALATEHGFNKSKLKHVARLIDSAS